MIKLVGCCTKEQRKDRFKELKVGDTFKVHEWDWPHGNTDIYMKTWEGFACIIGKKVGSTWSGNYEMYRVDEVKLEAHEVE